MQALFFTFFPVSAVQKLLKSVKISKSLDHKSAANRFSNMFSLTWSYDQDVTYVRPIEKQNRKGLQTNHATSRGGCGQYHDQNQVLEHG